MCDFFEAKFWNPNQKSKFLLETIDFPLAYFWTFNEKLNRSKSMFPKLLLAYHSYPSLHFNFTPQNKHFENLCFFMTSSVAPRLQINMKNFLSLPQKNPLLSSVFHHSSPPHNSVYFHALQNTWVIQHSTAHSRNFFHLLERKILLIRHQYKCLM